MTIQSIAKRIIGICCLPLLFSCHTGNPIVADPDQPYPLLQQDHQLAGKIWDVKNQTYITKQQLIEKILASHYVLLGETHDNMEHHQDHGWVIAQLAKKKPKTAVAFEMVNADQTKVIRNTPIASTDELLDILEKAKTGWEYKKYYKPVFNSVFNAKLKIYPADLDKTTMRRVVMEGIENAPQQIRQLLEQNSLPEQSRESLRKEIEATHCGMINEEMTNAMMLGQQVRDANIASNLYQMKQDNAEAIVLVSGSGHIRKDRGAPMYVHSLDKSAKLVSVAWLEVNKKATNPKDYAYPWGQEHLPFDYVVFTAQADRPDPCEEMKKYMQHKHNHGKKPGESDE